MNAAINGYYGAVRRQFAQDGLSVTELGYASHATVPTHVCPGFFMSIDATFVEDWYADSYRLDAGDVSCHPDCEPYRLATSSNPSRGLAVDLSEAWRSARGVGARWNDAPINVSHSRVSWLMARLYVELGSRDNARPLVVESLALEICSEMAASRERADRFIPRWMRRLREFLNEHLCTSLTLTQLAQVAEVSPVAVVKAFRRLEGMTPGEFVRHARLVRARRALATTDWRISFIGVEAGFYDQSHFDRAFTAAVGTTPATYRQLIRGRKERRREHR